jgi:DNA-binding winged helix-turn-helix (wHTH) protein
VPPVQPARYRFGVFELDAATGDLRRKGLRVRLHTQPCQLLLLLLARPGELITRDQIIRALWPDGTFVDYDHGINSAIARLRDALGDTAGNSRFIETLARRGYRFIAPVEAVSAAEPITADPETPDVPSLAQASPGNGREATDLNPPTTDSDPDPAPRGSSNRISARLLSAPHELPRANQVAVQNLFLGMQAMYLGFYVGALANLPEISDLLDPLPHSTHAFAVLIATAAILIPVRAFTFTTALLGAPHAAANFLRIWPVLLVFDELWALSPFLLLHHINFGVALACTALLVYAPFAQRSLILMGAARRHPAGTPEN